MIEFRDALTDLLEDYGTDDGGLVLVFLFNVILKNNLKSEIYADTLCFSALKENYPKEDCCE